MVFAHFRDSVSLLVEALEKVPGLRPLRFVGQASHGTKDKGLKQKEQIELLTEFKAGTYNVLVATSVAEEGLDVSECDLVVFYDVVPSEIRTIQRRGRTGRRREGRVVVLVAKGTRDEGYMWAEKHKEKRMKETLREMKQAQTLPTKKILQDQHHPGGQVDLLSYAKKPEKDQTSESDEKLPPIPEEGEESPTEETEGVEEKDDMAQATAQPPSQHDKELTLDITPGEVTLLIDHRETASAVVKALSQLGAKISFAALPTGDYVLSSEIAVERKASPDFVASIVDGRLFKECAKLTAHYPCPVLILEGQPIGASALHPNAIRGAIASVMVKFHITILQTADAQDTAALVFAIAKKAQEGPKKTIRIRADKGPADLDKVQEFVLAGVPGLNNFRAKSLLSHFGSLERVFTAEEKDLQGAEGIGPKLAKQVRNSATHKYGTEKRLD
jgi:ERCC4-type nuclease